MAQVSAICLGAANVLKRRNTHYCMERCLEIFTSRLEGAFQVK